MPGADDRDTVVDRGQPDHAPEVDRWSPSGTPPEPGWYDDPWNPNAIRRWDGNSWTGETTTKGSVPDAPAAPPPPRFDANAGFEHGGFDAHVSAPAAPSTAATPVRGRRSLPNPFLVVGSAAAIIIVAVVVLMSGHSSSTSTSATLPPAPVTTVAGPVGLASSVLTSVDLGTGWTASPRAHALTAPEYTAGPCGSPLWAHDVGGWQSSFVNGATAATAHGSVVARVVEAPSLPVADQQQSVAAAPAYAICLEQRVTAEVRSQLPAGSGQAVSAAAITPFSLNLTVPSHAYVVTITVTGPGGAVHQVTDNAVIMFSGRYAATVDVSWSSDAPLSAQIVQQQAANEAVHLTALS